MRISKTNKTREAALVLMILGMTVPRSKGQDAVSPPAKAQTPPAMNANPGDVNSIEAALLSDDNFQVQQALDRAVGLLTDPKNAQRAVEKVPVWLRDLIGLRRFDETEDFAVAVINARPVDIRLIENCQQARIRAKLLANKPQEALPLARSLYNVCFMGDTSKAIDLIAECLYDINAADDPAGAVRKFKLQQIHGAATTQPSNPDENILSQIKLDPKPYQPGLARIELVDSTWEAAMGKGNLLLLAGKTPEAAKVFDKAYALASDGNLAAATEAVARAMRAEDGTVGRANAWILSLRPPEQAAQ
jgi:hypothetical protein